MEGFVLLSGCRDVFCPGASEPRNMAYMNRLGIWGEGTPFREFSNFIQAVERRYINPEPFELIVTHVKVSQSETAILPYFLANKECAAESPSRHYTGHCLVVCRGVLKSRIRSTQQCLRKVLPHR